MLLTFIENYMIFSLFIEGTDRIYPSEDLIMVDLITKKIIKHIHAKYTSKDIDVVNVFSC